MWVKNKKIIRISADPRLKAFITHGGMNSILEALYFGVPLITLPVFGDQVILPKFSLYYRLS